MAPCQETPAQRGVNGTSKVQTIMTERQETQPERAAVMLTNDEKNALKLVAAFQNITESEVIRGWLIKPLAKRAADIRAGRAA